MQLTKLIQLLISDDAVKPMMPTSILKSSPPISPKSIPISPKSILKNSSSPMSDAIKPPPPLLPPPNLTKSNLTSKIPPPVLASAKNKQPAVPRPKSLAPPKLAPPKLIRATAVKKWCQAAWKFVEKLPIRSSVFAGNSQWTFVQGFVLRVFRSRL